MIVDLDGELLSADRARVSPFDAAYQFGDGVFDTLRTYAGYAFALEDHLERLSRDCGLLQIPFHARLDHWRERLERLLLANDLMAADARVRIQISRGGEPDTDLVGADPESIAPVVLVTARAIDAQVLRWQREGVRLMALQSAFARGNFPQIKTLNYLPSLMAQRFAAAAGCAEVVLVNRQSKVLEGATSNIFAVAGNTLRTPPTRLGVLPGVTRGRVLALARTLGWSAEEGAIDLRELLLADEVFITSAVKEIVPVVRVDQSAVGSAQPGRRTRVLQEAYGAMVEEARAARQC